MILSLLSPFLDKAAAVTGKFHYLGSNGEVNYYPYIVDGVSDNAFLTLTDIESDLVFEQLHQKCMGQKVQIGLAESCTGGMVASRITDHAGSSKYFYGGWVVYSNHAKFDWLQVSPHDLERDGAVSSIVVEDLLRGIFANSPSTHGIAVSGIAGPDGGSLEKPVGTVWIGVAKRNSCGIFREFHFDGNRSAIRSSASTVSALMLMELFWLTENNIDTLQKL